MPKFRWVPHRNSPLTLALGVASVAVCFPCVHCKSQKSFVVLFSFGRHCFVLCYVTFQMSKVSVHFLRNSACSLSSLFCGAGNLVVSCFLMSFGTLFRHPTDSALVHQIDEGKVETELEQVPEPADNRFDERNAVNDDKNNLNQNYFSNSQSQNFYCSQRTVIDCHADDNDIVKFLDKTTEAVERIMTSRQIGGDNEEVIPGDDVPQCCQSSIGSLGNGFEDMMLASQKADKAELEGFSQIDLSSQFDIIHFLPRLCKVAKCFSIVESIAAKFFNNSRVWYLLHQPIEGLLVSAQFSLGAA